LEFFSEKLIDLGYRPAFTGARKKFRTTNENVPIEIIISGEYPGDGLPKPVQFPEPEEASVIIDGVSTVSLKKLVELKLASGMTAGDRLKDLADVQELIKLKSFGYCVCGQTESVCSRKVFRAFQSGRGCKKRS
jgi:hypothetical protein